MRELCQLRERDPAEDSFSCSREFLARISFTTSSEITICTATATLQGKEIRAGMDKSFAGLYHDLDGGFTPLVRSGCLDRKSVV